MQHIVTISADSELSRQLKEAAAQKRPLRLVSGSTTFDVRVQEYEEAPDTRPRLDPARVREGLARSVGALRGVDVEALKRELREAREQDSAGRPA